MKRMIFAINLLAGFIHLNACLLQSDSNMIKSVKITDDVTNFVPGLRGKKEMTFPNATESDLKHLQEYCVLQYQMDKNVCCLQDPEKALKSYVLEIVAFEFINLTKNASILFPDQQPIPKCLMEKWAGVIQENNYKIDDFCSIIGNNDLAEKIYSAYQEEPVNLRRMLTNGYTGLPTATEQKILNDPSGRIKLDEEKEYSDKQKDNNKTFWNRLAAIKSAISQHWSQMNYFKKLAVGGGLSAFAFVCLYLAYRR